MMIHQKMQYYFDRVQQVNYKSFYLAFLRVAISLWLLKEVCINWPAMELLYGRSSFLVVNENLLEWLPGFFPFTRSHYMWFISLYILVICMNIFGIGRWYTAILLYFLVHVMLKMNVIIVDGGFKMAKFILFYMIFAGSYQYFTWHKPKFRDDETRRIQNLFSNLAALSIMLQLCTAYLTSGWAKLHDPTWWNGEGVYYALSMERFTGTPLNQYLVQQKWLMIASNYAVMFFELGFPVLVWIKKIRYPLLVAGVLFHAGIYIFMMIYGFQVVFVLIYGLFLPNQDLLDLADKIKSFFRFRRSGASDRAQT